LAKDILPVNMLRWSTMMSYENTMPIVSIRSLILHAWDKDRDNFLKNLGGINGDGSLNETRILQIKQAVESVIQAKQDEEEEQLKQ
jgi:hypothetical protein